LGYCYKEEGEFAKAEDAFKKVIELNPAEDKAYLELGWLYTAQRKYVAAKEIFERALELNASKKYLVYFNLGFYYEHQRKYAEATEMFKKTIELEPVNYRAHLELGWCYGYQGKYAEAEEAFKKAIELNPKDDRAYGALAVLYKKTGRSGPADEYYKKAESERMKNYYSPTTIYNYREIKRILDKRRIKLVCIQYPMVTVQPLKKIFEEQSGVMFVDNEKIFKEAINKRSYGEYFIDMFGGDFGHCTYEGNRLLAENIAKVILKECFYR